jgi:hypothetical protein
VARGELSPLDSLIRSITPESVPTIRGRIQELSPFKTAIKSTCSIWPLDGDARALGEIAVHRSSDQHENLRDGYVADSMTGRMRGLHKRLTKLEARRKRPGIISSRENIEQAAMRKLAAADRDFLQSKTPENLEDIQGQGLVNRWKAALAAASGEAGVFCIYLSEEERGWL